MNTRSSFTISHSPWLVRGILILASLVLAVIAWLPFQTYSWLVEARERTQYSEALVRSVDVIMLNMADAEAGERGYVITGNPRFLEPYHHATSQLAHNLAALRRLLARQGGVPPPWQDVLRKQAHALDFLQHVVQVRERHGFEAAVAQVASGEGKRRVDDFRLLAEQLREMEQEKLAQLKANEVARLSHSKTALTVLTLFDFLMFGVAFYLLFKAVGMNRQANVDLEVLHAQAVSNGALLEERHRISVTQSRMVSALQSCATMAEACAAIQTYCGQIFSGSSGAFYLRLPPDDEFSRQAAWGDGNPAVPGFEAGECWAARSGHLHRFDAEGRDMPCRHCGPPPLPGYLCVPMHCNGVLTGMLTLFGPSGADGQRLPVSAEVEELALDVIEEIGLAIANMQLRESLRSSSIVDALTGLYNRRYLDETLRRELRRAERQQRPLGLVLFDVDHFKRFNDGYGHDAGDLVLRVAAGELRKLSRASDIACRYGGEEFVLVMPEADEAAAMARAEALRWAIRQAHIRYGGQELPTVSVSLGVALFPRHGASSDDLLKAADLALYQAKQSGRDQVVLAREAG